MSTHHHPTERDIEAAEHHVESYRDSIALDARNHALTQANRAIKGKLWRDGYRANILSTLLGIDMIAPGETFSDPQFRMGYEAAQDRAENIVYLRDSDPLEFVARYGRVPVTYGIADAHATASASLAWRELSE